MEGDKALPIPCPGKRNNILLNGVLTGAFLPDNICGKI